MVYEIDDMYYNISSDRKVCPHCKKHILVLTDALKDGYDPDDMNTRITLKKYKKC